MFKKPTVYALLLIPLVLLAACEQGGDAQRSDKYLSLEEIRAETETLPDFDTKYQNLDLSETSVYIPDVDAINNFSLFPVYPNADEREALLLEAAQKFGREDADENNIIYQSFTSEYFPYSEVKGDPDRDDYYFIKYQTDNLDLGINIGGNYLYARRTEIAEIAEWENSDYWIEYGKLKNTYDLRKEIPDISVTLQDGEQSLAEIVENMMGTLPNGMPYYTNDDLKLRPFEANVYALGDGSGVDVSFYYEYEGVPLDHGRYMSNLETDEVSMRRGLYPEASAAWNDSVDELYGAYIYKAVPSGESNDKFISLGDFIAILSEKLTGNTRFNVESIELSYGLTGIYPDEFYSTEGAMLGDYMPVELVAEPVWIGYIPQTGIADTPHIRVVVNAVTGDIEVLS